MSQVVLPRAAWTTWKPKPSNLVRLVRPKGFAIHWPGTSENEISNTKKSVAARLEAERRDHVSGRGWSDIAYQMAVDNAGRIWTLRGIQWRSAANGNGVVNSQWGAITCLLGDEEQPSEEMIDAVRYFRTEIWLKRFPKAKSIVGHGDLYATECPGPHLGKLISDGAFALPPTEEEDMAICVKPDGPRQAGDTYLILSAAGVAPIVTYDHYQRLVAAGVIPKVTTIPRAEWEPLRERLPFSRKDQASLVRAILAALPVTGGATKDEVAMAVWAALRSKL